VSSDCAETPECAIGERLYMYTAFGLLTFLTFHCMGCGDWRLSQSHVMYDST
jgi:hypothetical protein